MIGQGIPAGAKKKNSKKKIGVYHGWMDVSMVPKEIQICVRRI